MTIEEIVAAGQNLALKSIWLSKGYQELLEKINTELAKIPDMPEDDRVFVLESWRNGRGFLREVYVRLAFSGATDIALQLKKQTESDGSDYVYEELKDPPIRIIRIFAQKIPEMFDYFLGEMDKVNKSYQVSIDTITNLIGKLK